MATARRSQGLATEHPGAEAKRLATDLYLVGETRGAIDETDAVPQAGRPYSQPFYWAAFVLME